VCGVGRSMTRAGAQGCEKFNLGIVVEMNARGKNTLAGCAKKSPLCKLLLPGLLLGTPACTCSCVLQVASCILQPELSTEAALPQVE
jgi:hypothetical protein